MSIEEFTALKIGAKVSIQRGLKSPPLRGTLADKVNESALVKIGHTPAGKPILIWAHYMKLKQEDKK
ncbi:hypothetical protein [Dialister invisus]|jgi:hypothetical protein|nr:MAG TPA: hypothetical protein [Caudoviricetes sp.]